MSGPTPAPAAVAITESSRLTLVELSVVRHGVGFIVGSAKAGTFIEVPPIAVAAIEQLRSGAAIEQVRSELTSQAGEDVDVLDFVHTLLGLDFVSHIDGVAVGGSQVGPDRHGKRQPRWIRGPRPAAIGWLFGRTAWILYAAAFLACLLVLVTVRSYRATSDAFFFLSDPVISIAILVLVGFVLAAGHEAFHWLAACRQGVAARFGISRRLYFLVFETDLTQLWSIPRSHRYGAMLAGMAFDSVILAATFMVRALVDAGLIDAPLLGRFLAAVGAVITVNLVWQGCIFMRNDLYAVMVNALGCTNLWRVTMLSIARRVGMLTAERRLELAGASPRDLQVARWYAWLCLLGIGLATWFAGAVMVPTLWQLISRTIEQLATFEITSNQFWITTLLGILVLLPRLLTVGVLVRQVASWASRR